VLASSVTCEDITGAWGTSVRISDDNLRGLIPGPISPPNCEDESQEGNESQLRSEAELESD
jgi:hypothetical protein